jgi:hypothetical protein
MKTHGIIIDSMSAAVEFGIIVDFRSTFTAFVKLRNFERYGDLYNIHT